MEEADVVDSQAIHNSHGSELRACESIVLDMESHEALTMRVRLQVLRLSFVTVFSTESRPTRYLLTTKLSRPRG